jgi:transposase InsO family protein
MSTRHSPSTEQPYGIERVCRAWELPRSTLYAQRTRAKGTTQAVAPMRRLRGPKPKVDDAELLERIEADLARSPFQGEGHRKVWARLRVCEGVRVSRKRVLRLMRQHRLLCPHRVRQGHPNPHDGTITTEGPNQMWGTDGARVFTVEDGWVWVFAAVEHWNAECVGWHVCKRGDRFAALEPLTMGLTDQLGSAGREVARGLKIRMDHGTQYLADHFRNQLTFWGAEASYAFVAQPQTNGVAERFNRTLKEQAIHGRIFRNLRELRAAVGAFVERYNAEWRLEKLGFMSPQQARKALQLPLAA